MGVFVRALLEVIPYWNEDNIGPTKHAESFGKRNRVRRWLKAHFFMQICHVEIN